MNNDEPIKQRFTCPSCGNNVSAPPEDVLEPVTCPHCGNTGMFTPAKPKPGGSSGETPDKVLDSAADALAASEFSNDAAPTSQSDAAANALAASEFASDDAPASKSDTPAAHSRKAPPRRKKSITPPRRAGAGGGSGVPRPGYRRHSPQPVPTTKEGFSLMTVFLIIVAVMLSVIIIMIMIPTDLSHIKGYPAKSIGAEAAAPRNLLGEVQEILGPRDRSLSYTEAEVNAYLNHRVRGKQRGMMKGLVSFKGAYIDFESGSAEMFIERTVIGIPFTMSLKLNKKKFEHKTNWQAGGGSIGKFTMSSRQFQPVVEAFQRLGVACEEEMDAVGRMGDVRFETNKIILDPNFGGNTPVKSAAPQPSQPEPEPAPAPATAPGADTPAMEPDGAMGETMEGGDSPAMEPKPDPEPDSAPDPDSDSDSDSSAAPDSGDDNE